MMLQHDLLDDVTNVINRLIGRLYPCTTAAVSAPKIFHNITAAKSAVGTALRTFFRLYVMIIKHTVISGPRVNGSTCTTNFKPLKTMQRPISKPKPIFRTRERSNMNRPLKGGEDPF